MGLNTTRFGEDWSQRNRGGYPCEELQEGAREVGGTLRLNLSLEVESGALRRGCAPVWLAQPGWRRWEEDRRG